MPAPAATIATTPQTAIAFQAHDHSHCAHGLLAQAEALAESRGARLTPVRRRVLEILLEAHRAIGAYEVLERLVRDGFGNQPPVVYRALDFLVEQGFAHRISRLNAFSACTHPGTSHTPAFFICATCHAVAEGPGQAVRSIMSDAAAAIGFAVDRVAVEAVGLCPVCKGAAE